MKAIVTVHLVFAYLSCFPNVKVTGFCATGTTARQRWDIEQGKGLYFMVFYALFRVHLIKLRVEEDPKKAGLPREARHKHSFFGLFQKASFNALLLLNLTEALALILIASPVRGLRPFRALRFVLEKVPNPAREILPSFLRRGLPPQLRDLTTAPAETFGIPASFAIFSINWALFMLIASNG